MTFARESGGKEASFASSEVGSYHWSAEYSGDGENEPASSLCLASSSVAQATPTILTTAGDGTLGGSISDSATLSAWRRMAMPIRSPTSLMTTVPMSRPTRVGVRKASISASRT